MQRSEKSAALLVLACLAMSFFSLTLFPASIHNYCSNRKVAALLGVLQVIAGAWGLRHDKPSANQRILYLMAVIFAVFGICLNLGFLWYFTRLCHHA